MHVRNLIFTSLIGTALAVDNPVIYWDSQAVTAVGSITPGQQSVIAGRSYAIFSGALWGAAHETRHAKAGKNVENAAIAYAGHNVLAGFFPNLSRNFDNALKAYLAQIRTEGGKEAEIVKGKKVGQDVAKKLLKKRLDDGYNNYVPFNGTWTATGPLPPAGEYIPTPPNNAFPPATPQ
ncbi:hypothetical protein HK097_005209, partial [Rhizophlyctis rosea]